MDEEITILFVDDEPNVLNALRRTFMDSGYTILTAESGIEGLKILDLHHIQVVVSDYRMPDMDGIEFLKNVCERWPHKVRLVLSGYADIEAVIGAINEGNVYKFVVKPWNDEEFKITIANAVERYFLYKKNVELTLELEEKNSELALLNAQLEALVEEKTERLEFKGRVVHTYQNLIDTLPVAIAGIDRQNMIAFCNRAWMSLVDIGHTLSIGNNIDKKTPRELLLCIDEIRTRGLCRKKAVLNDMRGILSGALIDGVKGEGNLVLVFDREDDLEGV